MIPKTVDYIKVTNYQQALRHLADFRGEIAVLAGGHTLIPQMKLKTQSPKMLLDITAIPELSGIAFSDDYIRIGANVRHVELLKHKELHCEWPIFREISKHIGDAQVRNRGTIGGSIASALPTYEWLACLMALDAKIELESCTGRRLVPAVNWIAASQKTVRNADELVVAVRIPRNQTNCEGAYAKLAHPASGAAIAAVVSIVSAHSGVIDSIRVAVTGVGTSSYRANMLERALLHKPLQKKDIASASDLVAAGVSVLDDSYANASYRAHVAGIQARASLSQCFDLLEQAES